ncbi:MAG TPA: WYL domain-containing protein [Terriglobales bacterium]|nr:WYL domain-containing protein [Terriglobales bacterium]
MAVDQELHQLLYDAIEKEYLLRFRYKGNERVVEPHDYGIQKGIVRLLCWQTGGQSGSPIPGWRLIDVAGIQNCEMLDQRFSGGREIPSGKHHQWDKLFIRVKASPKR